MTAVECIAESEVRYDAVPKKYAHIDFTPPKGVVEAASKGLDYRKRSGKGGLTAAQASDEGVGSGVQRAATLSGGGAVSPDTIGRMVAFFARHEKNAKIDPDLKSTPWEDAGYVAWLLWGGDAGRAWAEKVQAQMQAADKAKSDSRYDRASTLAAPVVLDSGGKRGGVVLQHVGVLTYTHDDDPSIPRGESLREYVPPEVLADPSFIAAIPGIPIIIRADQHTGRVRPSTSRDLRVGTVIAARFDAKTGELIGEYVIDTEAGLRALDDGWTAVSLRYDAATEAQSGNVVLPNGSKVRYDAIRVRHWAPNHLLLTRSGQRATGAHLRADARTIMDLAKLREYLALLDIEIPEDADEMAIAKAIKAAAVATHAKMSEYDDMCKTYDAKIAALEAMNAEAAKRSDAAAQTQTALESVRVGDGADFLAGLSYRARFDAVAARYGVATSGIETSAIARAVARAVVPTATEEQLSSAAYVAAVIDVAATVPTRDARFDAVRAPKAVDPLDGMSGSERLRRAIWSSPTSSR